MDVVVLPDGLIPELIDGSNSIRASSANGNLKIEINPLGPKGNKVDINIHKIGAEGDLSTITTTVSVRPGPTTANLGREIETGLIETDSGQLAPVKIHEKDGRTVALDEDGRVLGEARLSGQPAEVGGAVIPVPKYELVYGPSLGDGITVSDSGQIVPVTIYRKDGKLLAVDAGGKVLGQAELGKPLTTGGAIIPIPRFNIVTRAQ